MDPNPYAPPRSSAGGGQLLDKAALREVVVAWEKLRLWYNLLLLIPGVVIQIIAVMGQGMPFAGAIVGSVLVAIGANLAFFLGPLAELYLRGLFRNGEPIGKGRQLIFGAGLVVSAGVFLLALIGSLA